MVAVARLFFDNVNHLQGSWLTTGKDIGQLTLHFGADDLGSVMLEENVVSSAGARHRSNRTELIELIRGAGRIPAQRDTLYNHLVVHDDPADDPVDDRVHSHFSLDRAQPAPGELTARLPISRDTFPAVPTTPSYRCSSAGYRASQARTLCGGCQNGESARRGRCIVSNSMMAGVALTWAAALTLVGCTSSKSQGTTSSASSAPSAAVTTAATVSSSASTHPALSATITQYPLPSGSISNDTSVNGKRTDIAITGCAAVDGGWGASGTAKNSGSSSETFDITIFFTSPGATTLDYARASVKVAAGKTESWTASAKFSAPQDVLCVLRGVA